MASRSFRPINPQIAAGSPRDRRVSWSDHPLVPFPLTPLTGAAFTARSARSLSRIVIEPVALPLGLRQSGKSAVPCVGTVGEAIGDAPEGARAAELAVAAATGNRVLYKLALVPLKDYPFFLAQLAAFGSSSQLFF